MSRAPLSEYNADLSEGAAALGQRTRSLLARSMGGYPENISISGGLELSPVQGAMVAGAAGFFLFCALPSLLAWLVGEQFSWQLFWVSLWAVFYYALASYNVVVSSTSIQEIIERRILPLLSDDAIRAIDADLKKRFVPARMSRWALAVALAASAVTAFALSRDIAQSKYGAMLVAELIWTCVAYFILWFTAARATIAARFYGSFAAHLKIDCNLMLPLDPARSAVVLGVAALGLRVLQFWVLIACSILVLTVLYDQTRWFVLIVVPTTSFFSIGVGTAMFLASEADIAKAVACVVNVTLRDLERAIVQLSTSPGGIAGEAWPRTKELNDLHRELATAGRYRNFTLKVVSVAAPLVGPVLSVILSNWSTILNGLMGLFH